MLKETCFNDKSVSSNNEKTQQCSLRSVNTAINVSRPPNALRNAPTKPSKTPGLLQNDVLCEQNKKKKRKFPGPAGALPTLVSLEMCGLYLLYLVH